MVARQGRRRFAVRCVWHIPMRYLAPRRFFEQRRPGTWRRLVRRRIGPPCPQRGGHFFARAQIWGAAKYPSLISERDSVRAPVEAVSMLPKYNHRGFAGRYKHLGLIVQLQGGPMKKFLIAVCSIVLAIGVSGCVGKAPVGKGKAPAPVVTRG
jgi:hypothetical protein